MNEPKANPSRPSHFCNHLKIKEIYVASDADLPRAGLFTDISGFAPIPSGGKMGGSVYLEDSARATAEGLARNPQSPIANHIFSAVIDRRCNAMPG